MGASERSIFDSQQIAKDVESKKFADAEYGLTFLKNKPFSLTNSSQTTPWGSVQEFAAFLHLWIINIWSRHQSTFQTFGKS